MPAASSRSPHLTKATKAFVDAITAENNPPLYTLPPQAARRILADAQAKPIKKLTMDMHDEDLPVGPTGKVPTRFIRPEGAGGKLPIVFYFHGGGWILGQLNELRTQRSQGRRGLSELHTLARGPISRTARTGLCRHALYY